MEYVFPYSKARSLIFHTEYLALHALSWALPGGLKYFPNYDLELFKKVAEDADVLLRKDAQAIQDGVYPFSVLKPEKPSEHLKRIPKIFFDGLKLHLRRNAGRTAVFASKEAEDLTDLPRYYRRNFHFQTGGYLSETSASLYEHQVEMLFRGTADAMRRLIIKPLREKFGNTDGRGLRFLEIAAGTGRTTRFVHLAFPKAKIVALDLSEAYLAQARKKLSDCTHIDFVQGCGEDLPFEKEHFDSVYSVFLYHELPLEVRKQVIAESRRVLKKGGLFGFVDSIQKGDVKAFDILLRDFPKTYHEPFYRNYTETPMVNLLKHSFTDLQFDRGFHSKVGWGVRA